MGELMGSSESFGTWGAMRSPFYNSRWPDNDTPPNFTNGKTLHNREYENEGDGTNYPPTFFIDSSGSVFRCPPLGFNFIGCQVFWPQSGSPSSWNGYMKWEGLDNKDFDEFLGATLQSPTDSVYLYSDAQTATGQYVEFTAPLTIDLDPGFTTIGGMTAIT
jgi:hypothetical protein